jgi:hypothetical protein
MPDRDPDQVAGLPAWELAGALPIREPASGSLDYRAAIEQWGTPSLRAHLSEARTAVQAAAAAEQAALANLRESWRDRAARFGRSTSRNDPIYGAEADTAFLAGRINLNHPVLGPLKVRLDEATSRWRQNREAEAEALASLGRDFEARWSAGMRAEFVAFGLDPVLNARVVIPTSLRGAIDFTREHPAARMIAGKAYLRVSWYRVADHPALVEPSEADQGAAELAAAGKEEPRRAPAPKAAYGSKSKKVHAAIEAGRANLRTLPDRKSRAQQIANDVGCSPSLARQILQREGL